MTDRSKKIGEGIMIRTLALLLTLLSLLLQADESTLNIDRSVSKTMDLSFSNDENIKPKEGDFSVENYVLMSNEYGERWSVITLTNLSSGNRMLDQDHLMALFADGSRHSPLEFKLYFKGRETRSITVLFGRFKFPVLTIYSSNDI